VIGVAHEGMAQISKGLVAGERVIVDGVQKVRPGAQVQVRAPGTEGTPAQPPAGRAS